MNIITSLLSGISGAVITGLYMKSSNEKSRKFVIYDNCLNQINKLDGLIADYNALIYKTLNDYTRDEVLKNTDNIENELKIGFQKLVFTETLIKSKLSLIEEKELQDSLEKMIGLICQFYNSIKDNRDGVYNYSKKSYHKYELDLSYMRSDIQKAIENFTIGETGLMLNLKFLLRCNKVKKLYEKIKNRICK